MLHLLKKTVLTGLIALLLISEASGEFEVFTHHLEKPFYSGLLFSSFKEYGSLPSLEDLTRANVLSHTADLELSKQAAVECPGGKRKTTHRHKRSEKASSATPVVNPPKTSYEFCINFLSDSEDKPVTLQQQQWVVQAFEHLLKDLQKNFSHTYRHSISESFLLALTSSYLGELQKIDTLMECIQNSEPAASLIINEHKDSFTPYFALIRLTMNVVREGLESNAYKVGQVVPRFELPKFQLARYGRHSFLVNSLLFGEGDIDTLLSELIDLLCQTLHPQLAFEFPEGGSNNGLIEYLKAAGFITDDDTPTPKIGVYTGKSKEASAPHVEVARLIAELKKYYSTERPVQQLAAQLFSIEPLPKPTQTVKPKEKTNSKPVEAAPVTDDSNHSSEKSEASCMSGDSMTLSLPPSPIPSLSQPVIRSPLPSTTPPRGAIYVPATIQTEAERPEKRILSAFQDAVSSANLAEAKRLYKEHRLIIEGSKYWKKTGSILFSFLLRMGLSPKEYIGFTKKYDLDK